MKSREALRKGNLVAEVLAGSWRKSAGTTLQISESDLDAVTPLLYDSGTAALGWRRISKTPLRNSSSAEVLHQAYRLQSLQSEIHEQKIEKVFRLLRQAQVDAVLAKGWATAGMYSREGAPALRRHRHLRASGAFQIGRRGSECSRGKRLLGRSAQTFL